MRMTTLSIPSGFPILLLQANLTIVAPPNASRTILRSSTDPLVQVKANSTDVFFVAASALMGAVFNGCGEYTIPFQHEVFLTDHNDKFSCKLSASLMMCKHGLLPVALARVGGIDDSCGQHVRKLSSLCAAPCPFDHLLSRALLAVHAAMPLAEGTFSNPPCTAAVVPSGVLCLRRCKLALPLHRLRHARRDRGKEDTRLLPHSQPHAHCNLQASPPPCHPIAAVHALFWCTVMKSISRAKQAMQSWPSNTAAAAPLQDVKGC